MAERESIQQTLLKNECFNTIFIKQSRILTCFDDLTNQSLFDLVQQKSIGKEQLNVIAQYPLPSQHNTKRIVVIGGGMSAEREVSYVSASGVIVSLQQLGYEVTFISMGADIAEILAILKPSLVFNALHGTYGEDGCLAGLLNIMRIAYTGSGVLASSLAFNKQKSYDILKAHNIRIADSLIIKKADQELRANREPMERPYVIKPLSQGSSIGVQMIFPEDDFAFTDYDFAYGEEILVERYIPGREMQVAVLNGKALGALEISLLKNKRFYDYEAKYTAGFTEHLLPAPLPTAQYQQLLTIAEQVSSIFNCTGLVRVEFIFGNDQQFYCLEINTHPGMTPLSICPEIAAFAGISYQELVANIVAQAQFE